MSEYFTNFLVALTTFLAAIVCVVGLVSVFSQEAKAETTSIDERMAQLEKLYDELYTFHKSPNFLNNGYSAAGRGDWADKVKELSKDKKLGAYVGELVPDTLAPPHPLWPLKVDDLGSLGHLYMKNSGTEDKETLRIKSKFKELFGLHKSRKK